MTNIELFQNLGNVVAVEGNKPLLPIDPAFVWVVESGKVSVFSVPLLDNQVRGTRSFLFEAVVGDLIFGIEPIKDEELELGLLAVGSTGTSLRRIERETFQKLASTKENQQNLGTLINHWSNALSNKDSFEVQIENNELLLRNMNANDLMTMEQFHRQALQKVVHLRQIHAQELSQHLKKKVNNQMNFMASALGKLATITGGDAPPIDTVSGDSVFNVCKIIGKAMNIKFVSVTADQTANLPADPLEEIARASSIRVRKVILRDNWWRLNSGPLLAYREDDNNPIALIPVHPSRYQMHDPVSEKVIMVNQEIAAQLKPFAYSFYRPFPKATMSKRDLLFFSLGACWQRDIFRLILVGLLGGLLGMAIPIATGIIYDSIIPSADKSQLLQVGFFLVASAVAGTLFGLTRSIAMLRLEGMIDASLESAVWDRLLELPVPFFKRYSAGELAMRAMGIGQIRAILSGVTLTNILSSIFALFNFALLFYYDAKLAGVATLLVVINMLVLLGIGKMQLNYLRELTDVANKISGLLLQLIGGVSKFRVAGAENRAFYVWAEKFSEQRRLDFKKSVLSNWLETFNSVFSLIASLSIFASVIYLSKGSLTAGKFVAFNAAFTAFWGAMVVMSGALLSVGSAIPVFEKLRPILETEYDEFKSDPGDLKGSIEVNHISFRYKEEAPLVLKDLNLKIKPGEYIGLVGPSGSGKSSLLRVLLGFEKPESGRVYYDEKDLEKVDIRAIRRQLGVVLQNGKLMAGDIFSNVIGANTKLTMDDAVEAIRMAGLEKDINEMPMGMHTVISEGAGTISGGQRQRLLIARAIVNKPKVIFFDEATSALDNKTQAIVSESLDSLQTTRIVIAHRLSTVMNCDRIIVLDKGTIIEEGNYEQLMQLNGMFAELAKRQLA